MNLWAVTRACLSPIRGSAIDQYDDPPLLPPMLDTDKPCVAQATKGTKDGRSAVSTTSLLTQPWIVGHGIVSIGIALQDTQHSRHRKGNDGVRQYRAVA